MEQQQQELPGSPRRRKAPPLDLDAALYLQSQASYVQEPNSNRNTGSSSSLPVLSHQQQQQTQCSSSTNLKSTANNNLLINSHQRLLNNNSKAQQPLPPYFTRLPTISDNNVIQANLQYNNNNNNNNNISVDYIDCISNNDLQAPNNNTTQFAMKGIPHCRKHLRFHRNRVEPFKTSGTNNSNNNLSLDPNLGNNNNNNNSATNSPKQQQSRTNNNNNNFLFDSSPLDSSTQLLPTGDTSNSGSMGSGDGIITSNSDGLINNNHTENSVLYPISVSEVKKRTYFIGSLCQTDSLLGHDELHRYFPNGKVNIFVCTWNQNRKRAPMNLNDLLLPDQLVYMPDIYAIGIQEAFSSQTDYLKEWEIELQTTLGPNHVLLHSCSLGVLHLALFVRRDLIWFCSTPEESVYNSRSMPTNMIKTKGAVSIAFRFFGTSFMFTNCHFPAHENKLRDRIEEYQRIINSIDLPKNLKLLKPRYLSNDSTARFDCVFFMGDLNFRLEQRSFDETISILEDIFKNQNHHNQQQQQHQEPSYEALTQNDELLKVMETNQAFHGFDESQIKFPPTYKFLAQTNKYDRQTKRVPSYTDRILFRSKRQRHIQCLIYDWLPQLMSSDHKPVYCLFDVLVRPGHEQQMISSLNAGLFQRTIYLEALKRRAEDPESMRENGAGGSLICSIS